MNLWRENYALEMGHPVNDYATVLRDPLRVEGQPWRMVERAVRELDRDPRLFVRFDVFNVHERDWIDNAMPSRLQGRFFFAIIMGRREDDPSAIERYPFADTTGRGR